MASAACRRGITVVLLTAATTAVAAWRNLFHVADGWLADHRERNVVDFRLTAAFAEGMMSSLFALSPTGSAPY